MAFNPVPNTNLERFAAQYQRISVNFRRDFADLDDLANTLIQMSDEEVEQYFTLDPGEGAGFKSIVTSAAGENPGTFTEQMLNNYK